MFWLNKCVLCILWGAATDASIDISVDTSVDTRSSIDRYSIEYRPILDRVSTDTPIGRYTRWITDTSPILHRYFTDTSPILYFHRVYWLISVDTRSVDISADRLVDKSVDSIGRYIGRYYLISVNISIDSIHSVDMSIDSI